MGLNDHFLSKQNGSEMKSLAIEDASGLALLAQIAVSVPIPSYGIDQILNSLSCDEVRDLGMMIINQNYDNPEAKAYLDWANSLKSFKTEKK